MVVYDSGDSDDLMQAMTANLNSAKEIFDRLSKGSAHLIAVIDSGVLSGAAYTAGKELFVTYINPMLQSLSQAITDIENDLNAYKAADNAVRQYESHLDETLINQQLNNTKALIRLFQQKIEDDQDFIKNLEAAASGDFAKIAANMAEIPSLQEQLENLEQVKKMNEQELAALETFVSSTNSLFTDSMDAFKYALQGVDIINQSRASFDGTITFPAGANMSWLSKLKNEKFSSKVADKSNETKTDRIEIKWTPMNGAGQQFALVYVNGKLDEAKTKALRLAILKIGWENLKKLGPEFISELVGIKDIEVLFDSKSSFSEDGMSLFSLLITYFPATKALKIFKAMEAAKLLDTGIKTAADLEKVSKAAGLTEKEAQAFNEMWKTEEVAGKAEDIAKVKLDDLPKNVQKDFEGYSKNDWRGNYKGQNPAYKATKTYDNTTEPKLPEIINGKKAEYQEFDTGNLAPNGKRGSQRFVRDKISGKVYYTDNHYDTWKEVK